MKQNHKFRICFLILFLSFTLPRPGIGMKTGGIVETGLEEGKHFKSPEYIRCYSPTLVTFHHEDEVIKTVANGTYGEDQVRRTINKYKLTTSHNIQIFTTDHKAGHGYDLVMVDTKKRRIVFFEAKSTLLQTLLNKKGKRLSEEDRLKFLLCAKNTDEPEVGHNAAMGEFITKKIEERLSKTTKSAPHQLSRKWCCECADRITFVPSSSAVKDSSNNAQVTGTGTLKNYIKCEKYKFMRIAALTIVDNTQEEPLFPSTTYYAIIGDGDSQIPETDDDPHEKQRIVNAGLSFLLDEQEMSLDDARLYLHELYNTLYKYQYPIRIIEQPIGSPVKASMGNTRSVNNSNSNSTMDSPPSEPATKKRKINDDQKGKTLFLSDAESSQSPNTQKNKSNNSGTTKKNDNKNPESPKAQHIVPPSPSPEKDNSFSYDDKDSGQAILSQNADSNPTQSLEESQSSDTSNKNPRSRSLAEELKCFIKSEKIAGTNVDKINEALKELKEALQKQGTRRTGQHVKLSSFLLMVLDKEPLPQEFLDKAKEEFKKRKSLSYNNLDLSDLGSKMKDAMNKSNALGEFFELEVLPILKDRNAKSDDPNKAENKASTSIKVDPDIEKMMQ